MIRVVMFDSINGQKPRYAVVRDTEVHGIALEFPDYRFVIQSLYHLLGQAYVHITVYDANNDERPEFRRECTLRTLVEEFERDEMVAETG